MLSFVWPARAVAALFAVTIACAVWPRGTRDRDWHYGHVLPGSMRVTSEGYRFTLVRELGSRCADRLVEVHGTGPLADMICDGQPVTVEGDTLSHREVAAVRSLGIPSGKYDRCARHRCDRAGYARCRGHDRFE